MSRLLAQSTYAVAIAGMLCALTGTPALADHDHDDHYGHSNGHWKHGRHHEYYGDRQRSHTYYRDYDRGYYYSEPRVQYYAAPRVYVPAPPSVGLNLVFPFHHW